MFIFIKSFVQFKLEVLNTKSTYRWVNNFQSIVDNGRNQTVIMDLPPGNEGDDTGPTALEFAVMSLSGCIGTIFVLVAKKMRLTFDKLDVILEAEKGPGDPTVTKVSAEVYVKSTESAEKLQKCLDTTMNSCPVGVIYKQAGIPVEVVLKINE
ncbi:MAG: OsmC family peroxiredoxin [Candidatus Heimdallarchaeota archaeon]|nr:OsmC family peroxiredoxin [Candidatus Heimdallarchaeota archaeon]